VEQRNNLRDELAAVTAARRELSAEDERFLLDGFLDRLESQLDTRIDARVQQELAKRPRRRGGFEPWVVPAACGAAIPIVGIAAAAAGGWGVLLALGFVLAVLAIYAEYNQR
jgi:hypothetical protein